MSEPLQRDVALKRNQLKPVDLVIGPGDAQQVGRFKFLLAGQRWEWSDAVAQMHGYEPGTVDPDTELLCEHKHPEDRQRVANALQRVLRGEPFSSRHRIIDTAGRTHWVIVVGDRILDDVGAVIGTGGFYIDITETLQSDITSGMTQAAASRAVIEQAKGVLMATYGIDAERAFEVLVWRSQETNVKLRDLAGRFLAAMTETIPAYTRSEVDYILLTCHDPSRMRPGADRR
jgi:PAS domain S-box-containing protein